MVYFLRALHKNIDRDPLLEAERIARAREPGDGSPQTPVLARLAAAVD